MTDRAELKTALRLRSGLTDFGDLYTQLGAAKDLERIEKAFNQ